MDDIKAYEYLKMILEKGTISEAAKSLYVSQPSLSQYILRLEKELAAPILNRKSIPITLTDYGKVLFEKLKSIYLIKKSIKKSIDDIRNLKKGKVIIGSLSYHSIYILANVLPMFRNKYPDIEINIIEGSFLELEKLAQEGKTDFSILLIPLTNQHLNYEILMHEEIMIAANLEYLNSKKEIIEKNNDSGFPIIDLNDLSDEPFIVLTPEKRFKRTFEEAANLMGYTPKITTETNDINNAIILASAGMGVTFCSNVFAANYKKQIPIDFIKPKQRLSNRTIVAAYNSSYPLSNAARAMLDMLKKYCKKYDINSK